MVKAKQKRVEAEGSTVEAAIEEGLRLLNTTKDKVTVKVVCEEKKGLFGMEGAKLAKVIVSIK